MLRIQVTMFQYGIKNNNLRHLNNGYKRSYLHLSTLLPSRMNVYSPIRQLNTISESITKKVWTRKSPIISSNNTATSSYTFTDVVKKSFSSSTSQPSSLVSEANPSVLKFSPPRRLPNGSTPSNQNPKNFTTNGINNTTMEIDIQKQLVNDVSDRSGISINNYNQKSIRNEVVDSNINVIDNNNDHLRDETAPSSKTSITVASSIDVNVINPTVVVDTDSSLNSTETITEESTFNFMDRVRMVTTISDAEYIVSKLKSYGSNIIWACDTEVADIDLKNVGPVGNGHVVCISIYGGPTVDFGDGPNKALWVENLGQSEGVLDVFKSFFEDEKYRKVWHNYGFDRHVMFNHDIDCRGFHGDTMHMARLWDTSRDKISGGDGYSLEDLSREFVPDFYEKTSMKDIFGQPKLKKDGGESKIKILPDIRELQTNETHRLKWIEYSAKDAIATWYLRLELENKLKEMDWFINDKRLGNMYDFYLKYFSVFGEVLTSLERNGIKVDTQNHLRLAEERAREDKQRKEKIFLDWATKECPDAPLINLGSTAQMQHFFFGKYEKKVFQPNEMVKLFKIDKTESEIEEESDKVFSNNKYVNCTADGLKALLKERFLKGSGKKADLLGRLLQFDINVDRLATVHKLHSEGGFSSDSFVSTYIEDISTRYDIDTVVTEADLTSCGDVVENAETTSSDMSNVVTSTTSSSDSPSSSRSSNGAENNKNSNTAADPRMMRDAMIARGISDAKDLPDISQSTVPIIDSMTTAAMSAMSSVASVMSAVLTGPTEEPAESTDDSTVKPKKVKAKAKAKPKVVKLTPIEIQEQELIEHYGFTSRQVQILRVIDTRVIAELIDGNQKVKNQKEISIRTLGLTPEEFTPGGLPQVSASVLRKMAGKNLFEDDKDAVWGTAFSFFGGNERAKEACRAIGALADIGQIDATITNFLVPLQALVDKNGRIHCSLNLNTETGRLSSRRPNLQNQPALEKDPYKIRDAFIAEPGNTLIVADYGQLELRILAHVTNCKSMLDAFEEGGCFHSRTAVGMYDYIREAIDRGEVLLEWDYSKADKPPVPLVKDKYGSERRKAKTLNFSIAYGKTVHGLAEDWGISKEEAQKTLEAWYRDRPEVKKWQDETKLSAEATGKVYTLMGRHRNLFDAMGYTPEDELNSKLFTNELNDWRRKRMMKSKLEGVPVSDESLAAYTAKIEELDAKVKGIQDMRRRKEHARRASINTPIQGSAADIVMMAMIRLYRSDVLKRLGWRLLLQIHDEVILEGPVESRDEAMAEVRDCMENPFAGYGIDNLRVFLAVDAKSADSWYKAK